MIKNIIAPIQKWLLIQKRCVGCGTSLSHGKVTKSKNMDILTCKCSRIYIREKGDVYRRARLEEV